MNQKGKSTIKKAEQTVSEVFSVVTETIQTSFFPQLSLRAGPYSYNIKNESQSGACISETVTGSVKCMF